MMVLFLNWGPAVGIRRKGLMWGAPAVTLGVSPPISTVLFRSTPGLNRLRSFLSGAAYGHLRSSPRFICASQVLEVLLAESCRLSGLSLANCQKHSAGGEPAQ